MEEEEGLQGFNLKKKAQDRSEMNMKRENKTAFQKPKPTSTKNIRNQVYPVPKKKVEERGFEHPRNKLLERLSLYYPTRRRDF